MSDTILEVHNLKKYFKVPAGTLHAVDNVSFHIDKGETLGLVGESGCGKSTVGRVILRLIPHTDGQVIYQGEDILSYDNRKMQSLRKKMQIIFQDPYSCLDPRKTIGQIIAEPLRIHKTYPSGEINDRVLDLMAKGGVSRKLFNSYPHELDGGRRQRVGIIRALALNPEFIICDEPVSSLDVSIQAQILNLLQELQSTMGLTYLFISHDLSVVRHISNRILVMYLGQKYVIPGNFLGIPCIRIQRHCCLLFPLPSMDIKGSGFYWREMYPAQSIPSPAANLQTAA